MIKTDFGKTTVKGNKALLKAEFSCLIYGLIENKIFTRKEMKKLVKEGMSTKEKIEKRLNKKCRKEMSTAKIQKMIADIIKARKSGLTNDEDETEPKVETILDKGNVKVTKITLDSSKTSKDDIEEILKKLLNKEENEDDF